ncbi:Spore cortex protein YabQ (Spore_YabQ) [Desulfitobacterium dichloroeliminans LMG P-21439]|uniref:Spore cortex protein YabQ (Spore_YabQ) n=1 Tax=Desulfitobacterium dichloroeliminans (strain LMG P-21439 / DCA1) TaxID=871963 RepID=L0F1C9_DESDL|nr:spore cortex biosynthesis protein YabQ [Desulfitobacterium dichloroeliminans]AGA67644.1 Spore cortex protein YabQ (Spore_YabQ) [Desulfitobacterium dichloroeliminans LMG P-21439]
MISDFVALIWVVAAGAAVGLVFDFYRSLRKRLGWGKFLTVVGDLIFSAVALYLLFRFFLKANHLDFRFYIVWGSALGLFLYSRILSPVVVWLLFKCYWLIERFMGLILSLLSIPIKIVRALMGPPYAILRWFSLLLFRINEALWGESLVKIRKKAINFWNRLFPPRTNG